MATAPTTDPNFKFGGTTFAAAPGQAAERPAAPADDPYGPLAQLEGLWQGTGFNTIWRPNLLSSGQDRFLELNITTETIEFTPIDGPIPNRGLLNPDIDMFGLTYMQQVAEAQDNTGLHIEPGIWAVVPPTSDPDVPQSVVRMGSIPHGTVMLAQGDALEVPSGPEIADNNIIPFQIGSPPPPNSDFDNAAKVFTELDLSKETEFRFASPGVSQAMVENPNSVLTAALAGQTITSMTVLRVSTQSGMPVPGGGTADTAFLSAASNPPGGNANVVEVSAIFWIETVTQDDGTDFLQLQYTQLVQLNFNGLTWPHVSVATLTQVPPAAADRY